MRRLLDTFLAAIGPMPGRLISLGLAIAVSLLWGHRTWLQAHNIAVTAIDAVLVFATVVLGASTWRLLFYAAGLRDTLKPSIGPVSLELFRDEEEHAQRLRLQVHNLSSVSCDGVLCSIMAVEGYDPVAQFGPLDPPFNLYTKERAKEMRKGQARRGCRFALDPGRPKWVEVFTAPFPLVDQEIQIQHETGMERMIITPMKFAITLSGVGTPRECYIAVEENSSGVGHRLALYADGEELSAIALS